MRSKGTKEKILIVGRSLLQRHGYHGFSFQDIADELGLRKASLYDHYATKDELIVAILNQYRSQFDDWVPTLEGLEPVQRIKGAFAVFHSFVSDKSKVCPVLALAADFHELSRDIQKAIRNFIERWLSWLEEQIAEGQKAGTIRKALAADELAEFIYSQAIGAQFQARIKGQAKLTLLSGERLAVLLAV